jgi:hypothetical protein
VPAYALAVDTTITIVPVTLAPSGGRTAVMAWRLIAHPGPAVLAQPATLKVDLPPSSRAADVQLLASEAAVSLDGDWHAIPQTARAKEHLEAAIWYLPPSHGPPPMQSSAVICIAAGSVHAQGD